jgi:GNAT superfamily N-acetyltransferase
MNFDAFLSNQNIRNQWITERDISVYVRRSVRVLDATMPKLCLDIGSVEVEEKHRGMGIFTGFLKRFEEAAKQLNRAVYVESIMEPRLVKFLLRNGYQYVPGQTDKDLAPNLFKRV